MMRQRGITAFAGLLVVLNMTVFGLAAWKIWQANHPDAPKPAVAQRPVEIDRSLTVASAKLAYKITFPAGWDSVRKFTDGDRFVIIGSQQPQTAAEVQAKVTPIASSDEVDGPIVFDVAIGDSFPAPDGDAVDFLVGKDKYLLSGRKYSYTYTGNSLNQVRKNGDKDYVYSYSLGGSRELRVTYRVFAADPTDNVKTVDAVVRSIHRL